MRDAGYGIRDTGCEGRVAAKAWLNLSVGDLVAGFQDRSGHVFATLKRGYGEQASSPVG